MSVDNNLDNTYYERRNHIRLSKSELNRSVISDAAVSRAASVGITIADGERLPNEVGGIPAGALLLNTVPVTMNSAYVTLT